MAILERLEERHGVPVGSTRLLPICTETPEGLLNVREVASASPRIAAISWGIEDLSAAMGITQTRDAEGRYLDMVQTPGVLNLQPVYDLLLKQPGVVPEQASPAFCRIKQWENRLNMPIELPRELGALTSVERPMELMLALQAHLMPQLAVSVGGGYEFIPNLRADIGYQFAFFDTVTAEGPSAFPGSYDTHVHLLAVGVTYRFPNL